MAEIDDRFLALIGVFTETEFFAGVIEGELAQGMSLVFPELEPGFKKMLERRQGFQFEQGEGRGDDHVIAWASKLDLPEQPGRTHLGLAALGAGKDTNKTLEAVPRPDLAGMEIDKHATVFRPVDQVHVLTGASSCAFRSCAKSAESVILLL